MYDNRRTPCNWSHFLGSVLLLSCHFTWGLKICRVVWQHSASLPVCVFTRENRGGASPYSRRLWNVAWSDILLSTFWFSVLLLKKPGERLPERGSNMRLHFAFFFFYQDMSWNPSVFTRSTCIWWLFCYFFNQANVSSIQRSGFRMEESMQNITASICFGYFALYIQHWVFNGLPFWDLVGVAPGNQIFTYIQGFASGFSLENIVMGAFIIMGVKMLVCLAIIALPAVPAFTHYFNDESLSQAGSLPTGFLFLVINCDMALASI